MGILKIPRITEAQRTNLAFVPEEGELFYVTDNEKVYKGDGVTAGGLEVGAGGLKYDLTTGTGAAYISDLSIAGYLTGDAYLIEFHANNSSTTPTIAIGGLTAKTIVKNTNDALDLGDIVAGKIYLITYDGVNFQLTTLGGGGSSSTSTVKHLVKLSENIAKGQAVYITGADGTNMIVSKADYSNESTSSKTIGLIETTGITNDIVNVITEGLLAGLDTTAAGAVGDPVWLGDGGNLIYGVINKPFAPNNLVFIGIVTRKNLNNGEIFVKVQNGFELEELHDVDLITSAPTIGEFLRFDGSLWKNASLPIMIGATDLVNGTAGLVPAPSILQRSLFLRGDGTWATPVSAGSIASGSNRRLAVYTGLTSLDDTNPDGSNVIFANPMTTNAIYTIPNVGALADFVMTAGNQTIGGSKTLSSALTISAASNQLALSTGVNLLTITSGTSAAARTYTVPDVGATSSFIMANGAQSITGTKTFSVVGGNVSNFTTALAVFGPGRNNFISFGVSTDSSSVHEFDTVTPVFRPLHTKIIIKAGDLTTTGDVAIGTYGGGAGSVGPLNDYMWFSTGRRATSITYANGTTSELTATNSGFRFLVGDAPVLDIKQNPATSPGVSANLGFGLTLHGRGSYGTGQIYFATDDGDGTKGPGISWIDFGRPGSGGIGAGFYIGPPNIITATSPGAGGGTERSLGTKLCLYNTGYNDDCADVAIGIETGFMWFSHTQNIASVGFKWYGGATNVMTLTGTGNLTIAGNFVQSNASATLGFFGKSPVTRRAAYTQIYTFAEKTHAASTYVSPGAYVAGANGYSTGTQAAAVINALGQLNADLIDLKQLVNAIIDDLQEYGLFQ